MALKGMKKAPGAPFANRVVLGYFFLYFFSFLKEIERATSEPSNPSTFDFGITNSAIGPL